MNIMLLFYIQSLNYYYFYKYIPCSKLVGCIFKKPEKYHKGIGISERGEAIMYGIVAKKLFNILT